MAQSLSTDGGWGETMRYTGILLLLVATLAGCTSSTRRPAPPQLLSRAQPEGYTESVRLLASDVEHFSQISPPFLKGMLDAANGDPVNILELSGGGAGGAFGAGVLTGLSRAHNRPQFQLVTGVSVGALLAPFAYLGSDWDDGMQQAFGGDASAQLLHSPTRTLITRVLFPLGHDHDSLFKLVDRFVTPAMIDAVARENAKGRRLVVATTDLDKQETVLWDLGAIAAHGGEIARTTFRDVLVASASVPGMFPPMLIHVQDGDKHYDEMHVDGSVTAPVFITPLIAELRPEALAPLRGANIYMIINGQLHRFPKTMPVETLPILTSSFGAGLVYKTREATASTVVFSRQLDINFRMTSIPVDYPMSSFIDFNPEHIRTLFDYAVSCAAQDRVWVTPEQGLKRNLVARQSGPSGPPACPIDDPAIKPKH
jgi:hypothetical protein